MLMAFKCDEKWVFFSLSRCSSLPRLLSTTLNHSGSQFEADLPPNEFRIHFVASFICLKKKFMFEIHRSPPVWFEWFWHTTHGTQWEYLRFTRFSTMIIYRPEEQRQRPWWMRKNTKRKQIVSSVVLYFRFNSIQLIYRNNERTNVYFDWFKLHLMFVFVFRSTDDAGKKWMCFRLEVCVLCSRSNLCVAVRVTFNREKLHFYLCCAFVCQWMFECCRSDLHYFKTK